MQIPRIVIDLELKERIRVAYLVEGRRPREVAAMAGVSPTTLYRRFHEWGWDLRHPEMVRNAAESLRPVFGGGAAAGGARPSQPDDPPDAAARSETAPDTRPAALARRMNRLT